jgi:hypothetical protein
LKSGLKKTAKAIILLPKKDFLSDQSAIANVVEMFAESQLVDEIPADEVIALASEALFCLDLFVLSCY